MILDYPGSLLIFGFKIKFSSCHTKQKGFIVTLSYTYTNIGEELIVVVGGGGNRIQVATKQTSHFSGKRDQQEAGERTGKEHWERGVSL